MNHNHFAELLEEAGKHTNKALNMAKLVVHDSRASENDNRLASAVADLVSTVSKLTEALIETQKY